MHKKRVRLRQYYARNAGQKLREVLQQMTEHEADRHSLAGEVDLARVQCQRAVAIYEATILDEGQDASPKLKGQAAKALRDSLTHVSQLVERAAKVDTLRATVGSAEAVEFVVAQLSSIVQRVLGEEHPELARRMMDEIDSIHVPKEGGGASVTLTV